MHKKTVWIAAAGTGGHIFPAQALARELINEGKAIVFVGKGLASNCFFAHQEFSFYEITAAPLSLRHPLRFLIRSSRGLWQALSLMRQKRPSLLVGFGSYHTFPLLVAALIMRVPLILFESNVLPGRVVKLFSRFAKCTAVQFAEASQRLSGVCCTVDVPLRKQEKSLTRQEALAYFGLSEEKSITLLITGGSQGAAFLNRQLCQAFSKLTKEECSNLQVIHLAGKEASLEAISALYETLGIPASIKSFEERMEYAWTAADIAICRAGALTCAEILSFSVPALLIPYPYARDQHQQENARLLAEKAGCLYLEEVHATPSEAVSLLRKLISSSGKNQLREYKQTLAASSSRLSTIIAKEC
ncbi:MAG: UDP-N-acetylglucosamine--N-acetylmuramyl-(pentapeptide) pyrophosphoryl-undecaprenol N-acetylglucosamine transferase [Chlamydiae bacterium]|nr:UDP-N-acetylglucosamine--N-acetylmuramyl-(pentapeptide) pyrophosphoryl-undecaprenol N-acetylglucosamine transferase [Chlamydiota bacterium]